MGLEIDRMEIDDVGANPYKLAQAIIKQLEDTSGPIPVREIAREIDIYEIREESLDGLAGALIVPEDKSEGAILVDQDLIETRKRFTIAHEIGHYVNPAHKANSPDGFRCSRKDMNTYDSRSSNLHIKQETQANEFASELLMPGALVKKFILQTGLPDFSNIIEMSENRFHVSKEAAVRRYLDCAYEPLAAIFSKDNIVRYFYKHVDFPWLDNLANRPLPATPSSLTYEDNYISEWEEVDCSMWLSDTGECSIFEQTFVQESGYKITLLSTEFADAQ